MTSRKNTTRTRLLLQGLESRRVPTSVPPGNYSSNITSDTEFDVAGIYAVTSSFTVTNGATLSVLHGATLIIKDDVTLSVASGAKLNITTTGGVKIEENFSSNQGISVSGTLTANTVTFDYNGSNFFNNNVSFIAINSGGSVAAKNCTFAWDQLGLDNNILLSPTDLTNNAFDTNFYLPGVDVQFVTANKRFGDVYILGGNNLGTTLNLSPMGTVTTAKQHYIFSAPVTVPAGTTVNVTANARVIIRDDVNLTVSTGGTLNITSPAEFKIEENFSGNQGISVSGTLTANTVTFDYSGSNFFNNNVSYIAINSGGSVVAKNSTFAWDQLGLDNNILLGPTDLTNNAFDTNFYLPGVDVQFVTANKRFGDVYILGGNNLGVTLNLSPMGTVTTANLHYIFSVPVTVLAGTTVNVTANSRVIIRDDVNLTVSTGGTLNITSPAEFKIEENFSGNQGISVSGTLMANTVTFDYSGSNFFNNNVSYIAINSGGSIVAKNSTFAWDQLGLDNNILLSPTDLTNNAFDTNFYLPGIDVQFVTANKRFGDVYILGGNNLGTTLNLSPMGTVTTANQRDIFSAPVTVPAGTTVNVTANSRVIIRDDVNLTVSTGGTLNITSPAEFKIEENFSGNQGISVSGTLMANTVTFDYSGSNFFNNNVSYIAINSGGSIVAKNSTFAWDQLGLDNNILLSPTDLTNNAFDTNFYLPGIDVQFVTANKRFGDVYILGGNNLGTTLNLSPMGTVTTANQRYIFSAPVTVPAGTTVNVTANSRVIIRDDVNLTVSTGGTLNITSPAEFKIEENFSGNQGISVSGKISVTNSTIDFNGSNFFNGNSSYLAVNSGGRIDMIGGNFGWDNLTVNPGATANIKLLALNCTLTISSAATINIAQNNFGSGVANRIVATGGGSATINLANNYWGTTNAATINGYILDHLDNAALPTVVFQPPLVASPVGVTVLQVNGGAVQRSRVTTISLTFNTIVTLAANTFTLTRPAYPPTSTTPATLVSGAAAAGQGRILVNTSSVGGLTVATLTFATNSGSTGVGDGVEFGSLSDGSWVFTVAAAGVSDGAGTHMAADFVTPNSGNAAGGRIFRLFGDADGDGDGDITDFVAFRAAFGNGPSFFDADGDGDTDISDFVAFRSRFGTTVP